MIIKGKAAKELKAFMKGQQARVQENPDQALEAFCNKMEEIMIKMIKSIDITIAPGQITVVAPPPSGAGANPNPIKITGKQIT